MTPTTPMALDEVLAEEGLNYFERAGDPGDKKYVAAIRATIAALQSAHAEEVAGLRARLARVEADARLLASSLAGAFAALGMEPPTADLRAAIDAAAVAPVGVG